MNHKEFCYWLLGMMEAPVSRIDLEQCKLFCEVIYKKLKEVNQQESNKEKSNND